MDNNCKMIHETSLGHIMDIWNALVDMKDDAKNKVKAGSNKGPMGSASSIAKASSNLTMVFPVVCSRNISISSASMVSKALEKNLVSMLQRLFASWQMADGETKSVQDYISRFHSNINTKAMSLDDIFRIEDSIANKFPGGKFTAAHEAAIREDMRNINFFLPDSINETSLNSYRVHEGATIFMDKDTYNKNLQNAASKARERQQKEDKAAYKNSKDATDTIKGNAEFFNKQIPDADFKKANELMPTPMMVNFMIPGENGEPIKYDSALTAVKAKLYPIASDDIVNHISDKVADRNWLTNFFRASTREISFMKDFVLAIDKAKIDALSMSDRKRTTDKMWKVLERRAITSRLKRAMRRADSASVAAITTLVISQEEVEYLRKYNNVDVEKLSTILNLFESLNLMCICIVDESLEVAKFIYDEQEPMWETISFTHLEREASDNTYKKVVNLMTKVAR